MATNKKQKLVEEDAIVLIPISPPPQQRREQELEISKKTHQRDCGHLLLGIVLGALVFGTCFHVTYFMDVTVVGNATTAQMSSKMSSSYDDNYYDVHILDIFAHENGVYHGKEEPIEKKVNNPAQFSNQTLVQKIPVPEFVNPDLMKKINTYQENFAKVTKIPSSGRLKLSRELEVAGGVAVLVGGELEERDGSDTEILFRQESNFIYLTGFDQPGARVIVGLDVASSTLRAGEAWLFVPKGNPVWEGRTETLQDFKDLYDVDDVFWIDDFDDKLESLQPEFVFTFSDVKIEVPESATHDTVTLREKISVCRAVKTQGEIELSRAAAEISCEAHRIAMQNVRCGNYESDLESLFRYVTHNYGARFQAYIPIVGSGPRTAALHYNDNSKIIPDSGVVLVDAGAEIGGTRKGGGWTTDITRTWPCNGRFTDAQKDVYTVVYEAQNACVLLCKEGESFSTATAASNRKLVEGLLRVGILKDGTVEELLAANMHRLFMPHGLGHSVGLDVHDPGNISPFKEGMIVTCEPGVYFYPSLLNPAYENPTQGKYLNKQLIESAYINMGGFRLEDTVLVTKNGPDNLSGGLARTAEEIEKLMAEG